MVIYKLSPRYVFICLLVCPSPHHYRCIPGYQGNMTDEETDGTTSGAVIMCTLQQQQPHPPNTVGWIIQY